MEEKYITREDILQYAMERYGTEPEYLWRKFPTYAVLRNPGNGKWYAALLDVPREKLGLDGDGIVEILDIKCDPVMIGSLLCGKGFLPGYHMNKSNWITILLNGSIPENEIYGLLDLSYDMTAKKRPGKK